jgi:fructuronate reductase
VSTLRRSTAPPPVRHVHLGLGNFFRAHQAWYTYRAPDADEWGIAAFTGRTSARSTRLAGALAEQDGLFTLITRAADGDLFDVVTSLSKAHLFAEHEAWLAYFRDPALALVTTTVTEAGYVRAADGGLDLTRRTILDDVAALRADLRSPVRSAPAKLVSGFAARRAVGATGLTVVPCDNLPGNGLAVTRVVGDLAAAVDPDLATWIEQSVGFATTMVDRITPEPTQQDMAGAAAATGVDDRAAVVTEPFTEWVISGAFAGGRPRWEDVGATFTEDVEPFEDRKLWMLNGAHTMLAYAGSTRGHVTVADAMRDPVCRQWLDEWWDVASQHLDLPVASTEAYRAALVDRFANPSLAHRLDQIAWDGSQKLPIRILPTLRSELAAGRLPAGAVRPLAAWVCHLRGRGAKVTDASADTYLPLAEGPLPDAVRRVLGKLDPVLGADEVVTAAVVAGARDLGES